MCALRRFFRAGFIPFVNWENISNRFILVAAKMPYPLLRGSTKARALKMVLCVHKRPFHLP
jgi:hypothetical protein